MKLIGELTRYLEGRVTTEPVIGELGLCDETWESELIKLYPDVTYQQFLGFGGAFTESTGAVLAQLPCREAQQIIYQYYSSEGLRYRWGRTHIDSCDFSLGPYSSYTEGPCGPSVDRDSFAAHELQYIIPHISYAQQVLSAEGRGALNMYGVPWSPPAELKSNHSRCHGGTLREQDYQRWAAYLCRYLLAYREHQITITYLGIQNEPAAAQKWDSCCYNALQEQQFIHEAMIPALETFGLADVRISLWDHNRQGLFDRVDQVCRASVSPRIGAAAFHWYSGDHFDSVEMVSRRYPELLLIFSEGCIEFKHHSCDAQLAHAQKYAHNIIGDLQAGAHVWIDWNLVLDQTGGPNHTGNYCASPVMIDTETLEVSRQLSYTYIGHFSRYIDCGAVRIGCSSYSDILEVTAWKNPDGSIAAVIHNPDSLPHQINLWCASRRAPLDCPPESILSVRIMQTGTKEAANQQDAVLRGSMPQRC
jgi:glucosylceramidase